MPSHTSLIALAVISAAVQCMSQHEVPPLAGHFKKQVVRGADLLAGSLQSHVETVRKQVDATVQIIQGSLNSMESTARRLATCDHSTYRTEVRALGTSGKCGDFNVPGIMTSAESDFTNFCTTTCDAAVVGLSKTWWEKIECKDEKMTYRVESKLCLKGTMGATTAQQYCFSQPVMAEFSSSISGLTSSWDATFDTTNYCKTDSCMPKILKAFISDQDAASKLMFDLILKYMCYTPSGQTATCWADFATLMGDMNGINDIFNTMQSDGKTFCGQTYVCKRQILLDLFNYMVDAASTAEGKATAQKSVDMVEAIFDFACMQKDDSGTAYCYALLAGSVPVDEALDYDGKTLRKRDPSVCTTTTTTVANATTGDDDSDDDGHDNMCGGIDGWCAPWCKVTNYKCDSSGGKVGYCENLEKASQTPPICNTTVAGDFAMEPCTCAENIGQLASWLGCCLAAAADYICMGIRSEPTKVHATIDADMCEEDVAASNTKGYYMTKALSRVENSCGFVTDPRCTQGEVIPTYSFTLKIANADYPVICANATLRAEIEVAIEKAIAKQFSISSQDIDITIDCTAARRLLAEGRSLSEVRRLSGDMSTSSTISSSGTTNTADVASTKTTSEESGDLQAAVESTTIPSSDSTKAVAVSEVGAGTTGTKSGVKATSAKEAASKVKAANSGDSGQINGAVGVGMSSLVMWLVGSLMA